MMRQYWDIKSLHPDKIILYRMGDFYEMFFEDAVQAAPLLGITLTKRNKKSQDETPMCGVPYHSVSGPINKLLSAGLKVAICDQLEDPKFAKGIVKRGVTRVLTPGMVFDPESLDVSSAHYMAAVGKTDLACLDASTGEAFFYADLHPEEVLRLKSLLPIVEEVPYLENAIESLQEYFTSVATSEQKLIVKPFEKRSLHQVLELSKRTVEHLELFYNYSKMESGSLFSVIDMTKTAAGKRKLKSWLRFPLADQQEILNRQDRLKVLAKDVEFLKQIRTQLSQLLDIERKFAKLSSPNSNALDLRSLAATLSDALQLSKEAKKYFASSERPLVEELSSQILKAIVDEPPVSLKNGGFVRAGFSQELDEFVELSANSQKLIFDLEQKERAQSGINSLKVRYNNVFGFYIEITNTHKDKVPAQYIRKQTLTNAERYSTQELVEIEQKVLSAQSKRIHLENEIFDRLRSEILKQAVMILDLASFCADVDVYTALAWLCVEKNYCWPEFAEDFSVQGLRHPVVEQMKSGFVANDVNSRQGEILLITGPNMAGKSTLMRQWALCSVLAQMGSAVPAQKAKLPILSQIFTRIGASDSLSDGLSTFMVEMKETAEMITTYKERSLLIFDEVGRGTSTFDGMALAQGILEFLLKSQKGFCLFATHYHELAALENVFKNLKNAHMQAFEKESSLRFSYLLKQGSASKSFGIQVAELAGVPKPITERAKAILAEIEAPSKVVQSKYQPSLQMSFTDSSAAFGGRESVSVKDQAVIEKLKKLQVNELSPLQALNQLAELKQQL